MSEALKSVSVSTPVPISTTTSGVGSEAISSASAATSSLPAALVNLSTGNILAGVVVERGRSNVILRTDRGLLQLTTNLALKLGSEVLLEVQSVGAQVRFTVVSVDHRPPTLIGTDQASSSQSPIPGVRPAADDDPANAASRSTIIGRLLTAEIVAPSELDNSPPNIDSIPVLLRRIAALTATLGSAASADASGTLPGTTTRLPIIPNVEALERVLAAIGNLAPDVVETLLDGPTPALPVSMDPAEGEPRTGSAPPRTDPSSLGNSDGGREASEVVPTPKFIVIRPLEVLNPSAGGLGPTSSLHPQATGNDSITLFGTIVRSDVNSTEIATPLGTLRLPNVTGLKEGGEIAFEIVTDAIPRGNTSALSATATMPQRTLTADPPRDWPALRDVASALNQSASINIDTIVPKAGEMLGPALLVFLANLRNGGNAKAWLGKSNVDALDEAVRERLIDRLDDELAAESRIAGARDNDGWQTTAVPIADGQRMTEIRIHTQNRRKDRDGSDETNGSRFVIETALSALGPMQLDGLVRSRRFDLIVRTVRALPEQMRRDIEILFAQSLSTTDHIGGVSFRCDAAAWLGPIKDSQSRRSGVIA